MTLCKNEQIAELFRIQLVAEQLKTFIDESEQIHLFFSHLEGFTGIEILILSETDLLVLIRWKSYQLFEKYLPMILNAEIVKTWLKPTYLISHQPAILKSTA